MTNPVSPCVLITGATAGIGYGTARQLLEMGARVIVHGPTELSAEAAAARLVQAGADPSRIDVAAADFSRFDEVMAMAQRVASTYTRIDALVHNAAIAGPTTRTVTVDGNELTFQVNYLAPYLLTRLLTPLLRRAAPGRMVAVSSTLHHTANLNWADPQRTKLYSPVAAYAQSKLALTMFARALAAKETSVEAISVHPGIVATDLLSLYSRTGKPVAEGAAAVASLCSSQTPVINGSYYDQTTPAQAAPLVDNARALDRLWKLSTGLVGIDRITAAKAA